MINVLAGHTFESPCKLFLTIFMFPNREVLALDEKVSEKSKIDWLLGIANSSGKHGDLSKTWC